MRSRWRAGIGVAVGLAALTFASPSLAQNFRVNDPGAGSTGVPNCDPLTQTGPSCTLRDAITAANGVAGPNLIGFAIGGGGSQTITLGSTALPAITTKTTIDGTTQGSFVGTPLIVLDGTAQTSGFGLDLEGSGDQVLALNIQHFTGSGALNLGGSGGHTIAGNYIGLNAAGTAAAANNMGIAVNSDSNTIGGTTAAARNVISGNRETITGSVTAGGITIPQGRTGNVVEGNYIGTNAGGSAGIPNGNEAVIVLGNGNTIGGTASGAGNVISGAFLIDNGHGDGVALYGNNNVVQGNLIGTDATGTVAIPNQQRGINVNGGGSNTIGGTTAGARNVISGNGLGISLGNGGGGGNNVQGNYIGLEPDGTTALANDNGIQIFAGSGNLIGGTAAGAGNVISGNNGTGLTINGNASFLSSSNVVQGNFIGTDNSGALARPNAQGGIAIDGTNNTVGGTAAGAANTIAFNTGVGISVTKSTTAASTGNTISANSIHDNSALGIDLVGDGVTANDSGDGDSGPNNLQNFPVITSASLSGTLSVTGTLDSTPSRTFHIEIFQSAACDGSGNGEGATYVTTTDVTTNGSGAASFSISASTSSSGNVVTATATDSTTGDTSEFSACFGTGGSDPLQSSPYAVNTVADHTADGCTVGECTLREAIDAANTDGAPSEIDFDILGTPPYQIQLGDSLGGLSIQRPVTIDGTTQPGFDTDPVVAVTPGTETFALIFEFNSDGSTLKGLVVNGDPSDNGLILLQSGGNTIESSFIGTLADGLTASPAGGPAIDVASSGNVIGGTTAAQRNVIAPAAGNGSGSPTGVLIEGAVSGNVVEGNNIGVGKDGTTPVGGGFGLGVGVRLENGSSNNQIGPGNTIKSNLQAGVVVMDPASIGNTITQNSIEGNGGLGIDLGADGVSNNDPGDGDPGPNNLQNFPDLSTASSSGATTTVTGTVHSAPSSTYRLEFFDSPACDGSLHGEGATYLGFKDVSTNGSGDAPFTASIGVGVTLGHVVTAAATSASGDTSEFSNCVTVTEGAQPGPTFTVNTSADHDDTVCSPSDCTLREAINAANAAVGANAIGFGIQPNGTYTIKPGIPLPAITGPVSIDGATQSGPIAHNIELDGESISAQVGGLQFGSAADGSTITGLVINRFWTGIDLQAGADGITITSNFIGTDPLGGIGEGNLHDGIHIEANGATIGGASTADRNVIAGNQTAEIDLENGATGNVIKGNYIGTTASGDAAMSGTGSEDIGVDIVSANGNTVGGSGLGAGNVISGVFEAIDLNSSSSNNTVQGNKIGTNAAGTAAIPNSSDGIYVYGAGQNTITANVISGNGGNGINIGQITANPSINISSNLIGTNASGSDALGNGQDGVHVNDGVGLTFSGNTISGNQGEGIELFGNDSNNNLIQSNKIGTNSAGTTALPNGGDGIQLASANPNTIDANVISGNSGDGIEMDGPNADAANNVVTGNKIGLDAAGTGDLGNFGDGIRVSGSDANTIGGPAVGDRNVVSGNGGHGIELFSADSNTVQGNFTGTNVGGTTAVPNGIDGIGVDGGSFNTIKGNLASGNQNQGISIFQVVAGTAAVGNIVQGNRAGLAATGPSFVPNGGDGLRVFHATNTTFGGIGTGDGNESAGNGANGIAIIGAASTGNVARGNRVHDNGRLGIELTAGDNFDGITANDAGDADTGANKLQNFPVLTSATVNGGSTRIVGTLSTSPGTYTIDFYASSTCDSSGNGEGASWIGYAVQGTDAGGSLAIDTGTGITATVNVGDAITATATDSNGNTSEFSPCVTAGGPLPGLALTSDEASAPAGGPHVALNSVPPSLLGLFAAAPIPNSPIPNSAVGAAPIPNSPIPNSPIPNSPIPNSPIPNSPIANSGFDGIPQSLLNNVPLSSIPIDWSTIFVPPNDTNANVPVASLTMRDLFADVPALQRFEQLKLGQLQLQGALLRGVRFASFLFGATKIKYIPPYTQTAWCAQLSSCNQVDVNTTTVLGLDVAGLLDPATLASLGKVTVGDITDPGPPVTPIPNSPIPNSPIPNSPIPNSPIPNSSLTLTAIGGLVIGNLYRPDNVVDCTKFASRAVCLSKTLADAANLNAIKSTATFEDLLAPQDGRTPSTSPLWTMKFNAFSVGLIGIENLPWESWPFDGFQQFVPTTSVVHYHLAAPVPCASTFKLRALLPHGFVVKPGTSALAIATGPASPVNDPATDPDTGATWTLGPLNCGLPQDSVRLDFQGMPGFRLGEQTSSASLIVGSSVQAAINQAPVTVTQNGEPANDSASTAPAIQANTLAVGHIATSGDVDWHNLSTTGLPRGTKVIVHLRPPAFTDLDLFLTKPASPTLLSSPIPNSPIPNSPIPNSPLPDNGGSLNTTLSNPQPEGLQDAPIPNSQISSSGITRGDGVEVAQVVLGGDENGPVNIAVAGYNGAHSSDAYTLRVKVVTPPQLPACPARTYAFPTLTNQGSLPNKIASTTQTLFLMNFGATAKTYGLTAANNLLAKLNTVASRTEVKGAVLQVDGNTSVRTAKAAWDAAPCSTAAANDVVRKVNAVVAGYRAQAATVQNIVIVSGDELMPMTRISDLTTDANESTAVSDLIFTTLVGNTQRANALFASEFLGNTMTDDAYAAGTTIPWFGRELYLPQLAIGRLVETPDEINGQLQQYIDSNGILQPTTATVTGYDFMQDEAKTIKTSLASTAARNVTVDTTAPGGTAPLIGETWQKGDLQPFLSSLQRGIVSANGHYNHWETAPASPLPLTTSNLISTASLPAFGATQRLDSGSILFTMGCHAGLNVSDTFPFGTTPERLRDWAQGLSQNRVAVYVANTGYGYGDYDAIALSERLMTMFAQNLAFDGPIGKKLVLAKQQYFGTIGSYDPYAEKVLAETTFYGLPFYRVGTGPEQTGPPPVTPQNGVFPVAVNPDLKRNDTGRGTYWSNRADDGVEYLKDRPIEPRLSQEVTATGLRAHGVRITELTTHDTPVDPLIATPMIDFSGHEPEAGVTDVIFPATFATIDHWSAFGANHDSLVIVPGQTRPGATGGQTQRLVDHIKTEVLYSTSTDVTPPIFGTVGAVVKNGMATLFAHTSDAGTGVARVTAYFTQGGSIWTFVQLTRVGTSDLYTGSTPVNVPRIEAAFWSQDGAGNVAYTTDKGRLFTSLAGDNQGPEITIASPIDGASYPVGQTVNAGYSCADDGGVSSCTGSVANGAKIDTAAIGQKTFTVNAIDLTGNPASLSVHYSVIYNFGSGFLSPIQNPPAFNNVNAGSAVPIKFNLGGNQGLNIFDPGPPQSPYSQQMSCDQTVPIIPTSPTDTSGGSTLTFDSKTQTYTYSWKTKLEWAGTCRLLTVKFNDGTTHLAFFHF